MSIREEVMEHYENLSKFALRLTKNKEDAQDLLHDTVLRAIEKESYYQQGSNLFSWMSKIMFNLFVTRYRVSQRRDSQYDPEPIIAQLTVAAPQPASLELSLMLDKVRLLPEKHQEAVYGAAVGKTYKEMASEAGIPEGTIRSRLSRARQALSAKSLKYNGNK